MCTKLTTPIILGLDFAQAYHIGIDWNVDLTPYLRHRGKYLASAHPLKSMHIKAVVNQLHTCAPGTTADRSSTVTIPKKGTKMVRLVTKTQLRLKPKTLSVVPVVALDPLNIHAVKTLDVMGYPNLYTENSDIAIVSTTHTKVHKKRTNFLILLVMNNAEEEQVLQKGITLGLGSKSRWKVKCKKLSTVSSQVTASRLQKLQINMLQLDGDQVVNPVQVYRSLENTAFVGRHNMYTKPQVKLKDAEVSESIRQSFKQLKEEFKDIISQGPSDIGKTDLAEMTIDTKPDSIPHALHPYKLALQHQEFL